MKEKLNAIATSIHPSIDILKRHRRLSAFGELLLPIRSEKLMRDITLQHEPVDCLLLAIKHLKQGEADLAETLAWLNQAHIAYSKEENPDYWHTFADAIRIDIMTQLNGLRLAHIWKSKSDVAKQLSSPQLESDAKEKLTATHKLLVGLLGYHLGHGFEMNNEAVDAYNKLLSKTTDPELVEFIKQRTTALNEHSYLNPKDFDMCKEEFEILGHYNDEFQEFIDECCFEGDVPKRPEFVEKLTKCAYEMAGISVFAGPAALIAIPSVLIATPVLKLIDWTNYKKDQQANEIFYATLDDAHEWIKKRAKKYCDNFQSIFEDVATLEQKYSAPGLFMDDTNFYQKIKNTRNNVLFEKYYLGANKVDSLGKKLDDVEKNIEKYRTYQSEIDKTGRLAKIFLEYLKDTHTQLKHRDGKYHSGPYESNASRKYNGIPLSEMPTILRSFEKEFNLNCEQVSILAKDITSELKDVQADIKDTVTKRKESARNQNAEADRLDQNIRANYGNF